MEEIKCIENIEIIMFCGYIIFLSCGFDILIIICIVCCGVIFFCGYRCSGICDNCFKKGYYDRCIEFCRKEMFCGYECDGDFCESCKICRRKCEVFCDYNCCEKDCFEVCDFCIMLCSWRCFYYDCLLFCYEICDCLRCVFLCLKKL